MARVLVDTPVWVGFFRGADSLPARFEALLRAQQLVTCGVVLAELLVGVRSEAEKDSIEAGMAGLDYLEMDRATWALAGRTIAQLRRSGTTLPMSDVILAALALQNDCTVLTFDRHFASIPGLKLLRT